MSVSLSWGMEAAMIRVGDRDGPDSQTRLHETCEREARRVCREVEHVLKTRTWPTWWSRYYRNGRRVEERAETDKYETARDLLSEREAAVSKGVSITAASTRLTFDDATKDVQNDDTVSRKRSSGELDRCTKVRPMPAFGGRRLSAITTAELRAFTAKRLEAGASAPAINRELEIGRRAFPLSVADYKYHGRVPKFPMLQERNVRAGFFDYAMIEG